jgi:hypothetical protein
MAGMKLKLIKLESETWKRALEFLMEENVYLKYLLSDILKNNFDDQYLEQIETFQNRLIREDEQINRLRNEVLQFDRLLVLEMFEEGRVVHEVERKLRSIRYNMKAAEMEFGSLKTDFLSYVLETF